jgi:hypothetical protein
MADQFSGGENRCAIIQRPRRMVLDPLTEVGIGVFMPVVIGRRQLVVHILSDGERSQPEQDDDHPQRNEPAEQRCRLRCTEHQNRLVSTLVAHQLKQRKPAPSYREPQAFVKLYGLFLVFSHIMNVPKVMLRSQSEWKRPRSARGQVS